MKAGYVACCRGGVELAAGAWSFELELELELGEAVEEGRSFPAVNARGLPAGTQTGTQLCTLFDCHQGGEIAQMTTTIDFSKDHYLVWRYLPPLYSS